MLSRATVYADVNVNRPPAYSDYENFSIQWGCDAASHAWAAAGRVALWEDEVGATELRSAGGLQEPGRL